jgi:hypothetical protein
MHAHHPPAMVALAYAAARLSVVRAGGSLAGLPAPAGYHGRWSSTGRWMEVHVGAVDAAAGGRPPGMTATDRARAHRSAVGGRQVADA